MMGDGLGLDAWWDEPDYKAAQAHGTFTERGTFILNKLAQHDAAKLQDVLADLYRDEPPDPMDITKFQWQTILAFMGASEAEIKKATLFTTPCPAKPNRKIWRALGGTMAGIIAQ